MKSLIKLMLLMAAVSAQAADQTPAVCEGEYALCAASTGVPTNRDITVIAVDGTSQTYPEIAVKCPILHGKSIAGLNVGTMGPSCTPPKGKVYSLFSFDQTYPQAAHDFSHKPEDMKTVYQVCGASLNLGKTISQCWSMVCDVDKERTNGTKTATCYCPAGEGILGGALPAGISFLTPAGAGDAAACSQYPVALPIMPPEKK